MASLKSLASQTAIYGISSILGRVLNFALTPLHTRFLDKGEYGVNTDVYSMIAFLMVILTFGMETGFFRFFSDGKYDKKAVFSTSVSVVLSLCVVFLMLTLSFLTPLAGMLKYEDTPQFVLWMMLIVSADAIAAVPYAKLRAENRPYRFIWIRVGTIAIIVLLNLFFFLVLPWLNERGSLPGFMKFMYHEDWGVAYIFMANLIGNFIMLLLFLPELLQIRLSLITRPLVKQLLLYSSPLVLAGLAGIANEMANRQFLKYLLPEEINFEAMGIFGANVKIATFMVLFIQAFRFAAEPFFFSGEGDFKLKMARVMRYFVMVQTLIFLGLVCFLDIIKWAHFIDEKFWQGLDIVPILLLANLLLGINFNLNIWYKLKNKTRMGAYITFLGLFFTVIFNLILVPQYGYYGAAWATLISYAAMTFYSFYLNQKHDRTEYPVKNILFYIFSSTLLAVLAAYVFDYDIIYTSICFLLFVVLMWFTDGKSILKELRHAGATGN